MGCYRRWRSSFTFSLFLNYSRSLVAVLLADCSPSCLQTPALRALFGFADKFLLRVGGIEWAEREPEIQICSVTVVVVYSDTRIWCSASLRKRLSLSPPLTPVCPHRVNVTPLSYWVSRLNFHYTKWCLCVSLCLFPTISKLHKCECRVTTPGCCPTSLWVYIATERTLYKPHSVI